MNYKELLKKYMKHVSIEEGTTFVINRSVKNTPFTKEELKELNRIDDELMEEI